MQYTYVHLGNQSYCLFRKCGEMPDLSIQYVIALQWLKLHVPNLNFHMLHEIPYLPEHLDSIYLMFTISGKLQKGWVGVKFW